MFVCSYVRMFGCPIMNPLTNWSKIGKLGRTTRMFLAWYTNSKLSELTYLEKTVDIAGFPG